MVTHRDLPLLAIPTLLALGAIASLHPAVAIHQGLAAASLVSTVVLYDALFRNPPVKATPRNVAATLVVTVGWLAVFLF